jgi:hypothetical protein
MANAKPTVASLKRDVARLTEELEKVNKACSQEKSYKDMYSKSADEAKKELEALHSILDVLPGVIARKTLPNPDESWNIVQHGLMTRFAAYLATRNI